MTRQKLEKSEDDTSELLAPQAPRGVRTIRVTWGEEVIQPIQYNGVRVGAIEAEVEVVPNEDPTVVYQQTWAWLDFLGREQYRRKMDGFLTRLKDASGQARKLSGRAAG